MTTVVVLGTDSPTGLAVIRDLGRAGFKVVGIGSHVRSLGLASRYCSLAIVRKPQPEALLEQLIGIGQDGKKPYLVSIGESDINFVNRNRKRLAEYLVLLDADQQQMLKVLDKSLTFAAAHKLDIRTPNFVELGDWGELSTCGPQLEFPVVLKWANPHAVFDALRENGIKLLKLEYCQDFEELQSALQKYRTLNRYPLIQTYCAGYGVGQFFLCKAGESLVEFQHRRLNEWPPEGGSSTLCEALPRNLHAQCLAKSRALLRSLNWTGVAMVEYRFDPTKDTYWLMEINGRFWGSLPLATRSCVGFASNLVYAIGKGEAPRISEQQQYLKSRYMIPELKRLVRVALQPGLIADPNVHFSRVTEVVSFVGRFFDLRCTYYVFEWDDPKPFIADMQAVLSKIIRMVLNGGQFRKR